MFNADGFQVSTVPRPPWQRTVSSHCCVHETARSSALIALRHHITAAELHGMDVLVRVGQNEQALIQRVLDHGATGIVVPHVDSAEQAHAVVQQGRYAPAVDRGFATYGRAGRFGQVPAREHLQADTDRTVVIVMIESHTGCANTEEILAVPVIDGVMGGPADLSLSFGVDGPSDIRVSQALSSLHNQAAAADRKRMEIVSSAEQARHSFAAGAHLVVVNVTHVLMEILDQLVKIGTGQRRNASYTTPRRSEIKLQPLTSPASTVNQENEVAPGCRES
ncbi:HpcH/HpaI aldolase family protein [Rhodococcus sp. ACPA4]|uniref:HpcH/HpaI aldolase family protein n=1 Tax=Rhodococcus sp. ACPA4 TaxID=2028571 RepID=UPI0026D3FFDC|nr:aldolase/citrate lyase family protein [Rhodococcus sp. ACPA4]